MALTDTYGPDLAGSSPNQDRPECVTGQPVKRGGGGGGVITTGAMHHQLFHKGGEKPGKKAGGGETIETKCRFQQLDSHWKPLT